MVGFRKAYSSVNSEASIQYAISIPYYKEMYVFDNSRGKQTTGNTI